MDDDALPWSLIFIRKTNNSNAPVWVGPYDDAAAGRRRRRYAAWNEMSSQSLSLSLSVDVGATQETPAS